MEERWRGRKGRPEGDEVRLENFRQITRLLPITCRFQVLPSPNTDPLRLSSNLLGSKGSDNA